MNTSFIHGEIESNESKNDFKLDLKFHVSLFNTP